MCEYGVTIVDAVTGAVTMGQFADDVLRSRMQTLLASFGPSEVSGAMSCLLLVHLHLSNTNTNLCLVTEGCLRRRRKWCIQDADFTSQVIMPTYHDI